MDYSLMKRESSMPLGKLSKIEEVTKRLMYLYKDQRCRLDPSYMGFSPRSPKSSKSWVQFLKVARLVTELSADPEDYIKSQFVFRSKVPYPNTLYSDYAKFCYEQYMREKNFVDNRVPKTNKYKSVAQNLRTLFKIMQPLDALENIRYMLDDEEYEEIFKLIDIYSPAKVLEILND